MAEILTVDEINKRLHAADPITPKQYEFCRFFAIHGIGMKAIRDAGFFHSTAGSQSSGAYRLLQKDKIRRVINMFRGNDFE